jgi:hypothetical protein
MGHESVRGVGFGRGMTVVILEMSRAPEGEKMTINTKYRC